MKKIIYIRQYFGCKWNLYTPNIPKMWADITDATFNEKYCTCWAQRKYCVFRWATLHSCIVLVLLHNPSHHCICISSRVMESSAQTCLCKYFQHMHCNARAQIIQCDETCSVHTCKHVTEEVQAETHSFMKKYVIRGSLAMPALFTCRTFYCLLQPRLLIYRVLGMEILQQCECQAQCVSTVMPVSAATSYLSHARVRRQADRLNSITSV